MNYWLEIHTCHFKHAKTKWMPFKYLNNNSISLMTYLMLTKTIDQHTLKCTKWPQQKFMGWRFSLLILLLSFLEKQKDNHLNFYPQLQVHTLLLQEQLQLTLALLVFVIVSVLVWVITSLSVLVLVALLVTLWVWVMVGLFWRKKI